MEKVKPRATWKCHASNIYRNLEPPSTHKNWQKSQDVPSHKGLKPHFNTFFSYSPSVWLSDASGMVSGIFPCFQACTVSHQMQHISGPGFWNDALSGNRVSMGINIVPFKTAISGTYSPFSATHPCTIWGTDAGTRHEDTWSQDMNTIETLLTSSIAARSPAKSLPGAREITPGWQQHRRCVLIQWMVSLGKISRLKVKTMLSTPQCYGQTVYIILINTVQ